MTKSLNKLSIPISFREQLDEFEGKKSRKIRDHLREREFVNWTTGYKTRGKGVILSKNNRTLTNGSLTIRASHLVNGPPY